MSCMAVGDDHTGPRFTRKVEDFVCDHCGRHVTGTGYTNHCPQCLWSKHVDVFPGDRQQSCQGMMKPLRIEQKRGKYVIVHRCLKCGVEKRNTATTEDRFSAIVDVASRQSGH